MDQAAAASSSGTVLFADGFYSRRRRWRLPGASAQTWPSPPWRRGRRRTAGTLVVSSVSPTRRVVVVVRTFLSVDRRRRLGDGGRHWSVVSVVFVVFVVVVVMSDHHHRAPTPCKSAPQWPRPFRMASRPVGVGARERQLCAVFPTFVLARALVYYKQ